MNIGSHLSIAGGLHNALLSADKYGFSTVAIFVRNQRQWKSPPLSDEAVAEFKRVRREVGVGPVVAHASYLINLASDGEVRGKSIDALAGDVERCNRLGVEYLVLHPGSCADLQGGIARIAAGLNEIIAAGPARGGCKILLETTAGQGNCIGHRFEHLAEIFRQLDKPRRFGVCLDTAHIFAAGYDIRTPQAYRETFDEFDRIIGLARLKAIHCNDSLKPLGSRVDRHAHIGHGEIGTAGFANLVNDPAMQDIPLIMETPKAKDEDGNDWDNINATKLKSLVK